MSLLLGQLIYTSFDKIGFKALSSTEVPPEIQQVFIEQIVYQFWDSYNPPSAEYCAVYIHQITNEHTLFGWLYNDGSDDLGRNHVPYFICYYLTGRLQLAQLDAIFSCLSKGTMSFFDRSRVVDRLPSINIPSNTDYQPIRAGVAISPSIRRQCYQSLEQENLIRLLVPAEKDAIEDFDSKSFILEELRSPEILAQTSGGRQLSTRMVISPSVELCQPENYQQILLSALNRASQAEKISRIPDITWSLRLEIAANLLSLIAIMLSSFLLLQQLPASFLFRSPSAPEPANHSNVYSWAKLILVEERSLTH